jgi:prepilin-type processing-associated H-X9-DG protein
MASTLQVDGSITSSAVATITTADNSPQLILASTDADANSGPHLTLFRNSASAADNDLVGRIDFNGRNDAPESITYAQIEVALADVTDGTEDGQVKFKTMNAGALTDRLTFADSETTINDGSIDLDFRVESNGNANMLFVDGGNDAVGIGNNNPNDFGANTKDLVIGTTSGEHGMTIVSGTGNGGRIQFADNTASPFRGAFEYDHSSDKFIFYVAGSPVMRIDSANKVLINTASTLGAGQGVLHLKGATNNTVSVMQVASNGEKGFDFRNAAGTQVGHITINSSATAFSTSSDYRLKENVTTSWDATSRIKQLKPSRFNFIADADTTVDGFLAHEVSSIVPEAISGTKDGTEDITNVVLNADGTVNSNGVSQADWTSGKSDETYANDTTWVASKTVPKYQGIDQSKLVPLLVKTIQELEARIKTLEDA